MSRSSEQETCWICGASAATREHRAKATDIKSELGIPSRTSPFFFSDDPSGGERGRRNVPVGSLHSKVLKFTHRICEACNSRRTQPHDYAWEAASTWLRGRSPALLAAGSFRANALFPYETRARMLRVHLYFVKLFGCQIVEGALPIDVKPFANAILDGQAHQNMFLAFGRLSMPPRSAGGSDVHADQRADGQIGFASWLYQVGDLAVNLLYAPPDQRLNRPAVAEAWHPSRGAKRLTFANFDRRGD